MTRRPRYTIIEHPSDVGFDLQAPDLATLYEDAALTYYDMLVGLDRIRACEDRIVDVEGSDDEDLMVALLSECLVLTEVDQVIFSQSKVDSLEGHRLRMTLRGEAVDEERHPFDLGIKAVTYHDLKVARQADGTWHARVILDI